MIYKMKNYSIAILLLFFILITTGCVRIGNKVALISNGEETIPAPKDYFKLSIYEKPNTSSLLIASNTELVENREILQSVIEKYNTQNNFQEGERSIDIKLSFTREKSDTQLDSYEFISGIFTFFTLGIWPTIMSDEYHGIVTMQNDSTKIKVPLSIKKRYVYGWLSLFPVPGFAKWRGNEKNIIEGEVLLIENAVMNNLYQFKPQHQN